MSSMMIEVARPDSSALATEANPFLALVESMVIDSSTMYEVGADELKSIKAKSAALEDRRKKIKAPIIEAGREVDELFRAPIEVLSRAESILKAKLIAFQQAEEKRLREEQAAREEAARIERERLAAEAAALEAAARAQREEAARLAAAGNAAAAEAARVEAEAAQARAETKADIAALVVAAPAAVAAAPAVKGIATKKSIDFEVVDKLALIRWIAEHPEDQDLVAVDTVKLRARVRAAGEHCNLPGVRVFETTSLSASRKG